MASGGASSTLPDDVAAEQVQRLSAFSLVAGGLWAVGLLMDSVVFPLALGATVPRVALVIEALGIAGAIATYAWVRYSRSSLQKKSDAGPWLMMLNAADIALLETWATDPTTAMRRPSVVGGGRDPALRDDRAEHAAQDAAGRAGLGLVRSDRRVAGPPARGGHARRRCSRS